MKIVTQQFWKSAAWKFLLEWSDGKLQHFLSDML